MNVLLLIITAVLFTAFPFSNVLYAVPINKDSASLQIRSSEHPNFSRIVLEGAKNLISQGQVKHKGNDIFIKFSDADFSLKHKTIHVPYKKNNDTVTVSLDHPGDMKVFTLKNPDRLVIDVLKKTATADKGTKENEVKKNNNGRSVSLFTTEAEASVIQGKEDIRKPVTEQPRNDGNTATAADDTDDEYGFIPEKYKKIWSTYKKENNPYKAISELSASKPSDVESLAVYHFIYGEALSSIKRYFDAIEQLRLGYIYASDEKLKEVSLIKRAEVYAKLGFVYEARNNYFVFIRDYPSSKYLSKAHLGMANSLSEIGNFTEAVDHYGKAGKHPEVMFNMANALQKLEKVDEARKAYVNAMLVDRTYPDGSPETYYLMADNLRMSGKLSEAKKNLLTITTGPFRDSASLSLGLISMEETNNEEAIKYFQTIAFTRNIKVKVKALFNLSLAFLKTGKLKESISTLEDVRKNYPDSAMYNEALLILSRLYRHEGRTKESVYLLKELVYGNKPPKEAFSELETILLQASEKTGPWTEGELHFTDLWREVGQWMLDESRGEFLLKMAKSLKPEGKPFLQLCAWLAENATGNVRVAAAIDLADYYTGVEDMQLAEKYFMVVKETNKELKVKQSNDPVLRIEAKIDQGHKNTEQALKNIMSIKEFDKGDFKLLGKIITDLKQAGSNNIKQAVVFYEKMINKFEGEAEDYVRLADIIYDTDEEKALKYYRTAYEKNPQDEWTIYRIGLIDDMPDTSTMLGKLQKGDNLLSRFAKTKLMEINLLNKMNEVYQ
jgi:tetratricopeptide (TPR) repeat protein